MHQACPTLFLTPTNRVHFHTQEDNLTRTQVVAVVITKYDACKGNYPASEAITKYWQ